MIINMLRAGFVASFFLNLFGCATPPQTLALKTNPPSVSVSHTISNVPFYSQKQFYCGPTTLSEVLNFYGRNLSPDDIAPDLFVPTKEGTFQVEMVASARSYGLLAYQDKGTMKQLIELVSDNIPVIVFQNLSIDWFPVWHYALVIGYDVENEYFILHSGTIREHKTDFDTFERTWQRGKFWLLALVPPSKSSPYFNSFVYTRAAQDLISTRQLIKGIKALEQATNQWPEYWLPYFLLGNYYLNKDLSMSVLWYSRGVIYAKNQAAYYNNYAFALSLSGQLNEALKFIQKARNIEPEDPDIQETFNDILVKMSDSS